MSEELVPTGEKTKRRGRWKPGESGNPNGRPYGSRNKVLRALEAITEAGAESVLKAMVVKGMKGDTQAAGIVLNQISPGRKDRPIDFPLPGLNQPGGAINAMAEIARGVGAGEITPSEAADLSKVVRDYIETVTADDLAKRLEALETKAGQP